LNNGRGRLKGVHASQTKARLDFKVCQEERKLHQTRQKAAGIFKPKGDKKSREKERRRLSSLMHFNDSILV